MEKDEIIQRKETTLENFEKALSLEEQSERSTLMDEMRAEVVGLYDEIVGLLDKAEDLKNKNEKLVEANTALFTKIDYSKDNPETKKKKNEGLSLDNLI